MKKLSQTVELLEIMLISHKYKFIFIKARKVSGTSTEAYLERYCMSDIDEERHIPSHGISEYVSDWGIIGSRLTKPFGKWFNHKKPLEIKNEIGDEIWNSYKKICNIRNPYDVAVSLFFFKNQKNLNFDPNTKSFEKFLNQNLNNLLDNKGYWKVNGNFTHDFYLRKENLKEDIFKLIETLSLKKYESEIPLFKKIDRPHYSKFYNSITKKIIYNNFEDVLEHFKYKFEEVS